MKTPEDYLNEQDPNDEEAETVRYTVIARLRSLMRSICQQQFLKHMMKRLLRGRVLGDCVLTLLAAEG